MRSVFSALALAALVLPGSGSAVGAWGQSQAAWSDFTATRKAGTRGEKLALNSVTGFWRILVAGDRPDMPARKPAVFLANQGLGRSQ